MGDPAAASIYAAPRTVDDVADCAFYHVMEVPGHGLVNGQWDLRDGFDAYLGGIDLRGKRVLEMGTASGFLCFEMEKRGADVVALDLSEDLVWDYVPYARMQDVDGYVAGGKAFFRRLNNGWWFAHARFGSKAKALYRTVYQVPDELGQVDVTTFGMILLHLHNPFLALASALRLTRETAVVVNPLPEAAWEANVMGGYTRRWAATPRPGAYDHLREAGKWLDVEEPPDGSVGVRVKQAVKRLIGPSLLRRLLKRPSPPPLTQVPCMVFVPRFDDHTRPCTWWYVSPVAVQQMLAVLGFEDSQVTYHEQKFDGQPKAVSTVVARRTQPMPSRFDLGCAPA
jgi:hypothetical protein